PMKRVALVMTVLAARLAAADTPTAVTEIVTDDSFDPDRASQLEGNGIAVRQGIVLHPSIGFQLGDTTNVFYSDEDTHNAAFTRPVAGIYFATDSAKLEDLGTPDPNAPDVELTPRTFALRTGLQIGYQEYLSGDDVVRSQSNLSARALVDFTLFPAGPFVLTT